MSRTKILVVCCTCACMLLWQGICEGSQYQIHVLDKPGGLYPAAATRIDDHGLIVGYSYVDATKSLEMGAYYWDSAGAHYSGIALGSYVIAGVNNAGTIVGNQYVRSNDILTTLPVLLPAFPYNGFRDINDAGVVVGSSCYDTGRHQRAAYWDSSGVHAIGTDVTSWANAINSSGHIAGIRYTGPNIRTPFSWDNGLITDIGVLSGCISGDANDVNDLGQVVGSCYGSDSFYQGPFRKAFLWQNGHTTDLLGWSDKATSATGINNSGQVVGYSYTSAGQYSAFLWENGAITQLEGLGGDTLALGINSDGWIVGSSIGTDKGKYAVVWEPVPEPSSLLVLVSGIAGFGWARRRVIG